MNEAKLFFAGLSWWMNGEGMGCDDGAGDGAARNALFNDSEGNLLSLTQKQ